MYIASEYPFTKSHLCRDMLLCLINYYLITYYYGCYSLSIFIIFTLIMFITISFDGGTW